MRLSFSLSVLVLCATPSFAVEFHPLYIGTRAQAMGNAFVAVADDEQAIFINPAGLAGVKGYSFHLLATDVEMSDTFLNSYADLTGILASASPSAFNGLVGKNLYARAQATSTFIAKGLGFAAIYDYQGLLRMENKASPSAELGALNTYGGQIAFGTRIVRFGGKVKSELRLGMAGKVLMRSGYYQSFGTTDIMALNTASITNALASKGIGFGADVGMQLVQGLRKNLQLNTGFAMTDLGNTAFSGGAAAQESNMTVGSALIFREKEMMATLAADYAHVFEYIDWRKKTHFGLELKFPVVSLYGGLSQLNFTYGAGLNLGLLKIMYASYGEELATLAGQDIERRHRLYFSVKIDL